MLFSNSSLVSLVNLKLSYAQKCVILGPCPLQGGKRWNSIKSCLSEGLVFLKAICTPKVVTQFPIK